MTGHLEDPMSDFEDAVRQARPAGAIHQAGMLDHQGLQLCTRCGLVLTDYRGAMVPEGQPPLQGWAPGASIEVFPGNPTQLVVVYELPDCEPLVGRPFA